MPVKDFKIPDSGYLNAYGQQQLRDEIVQTLPPKKIMMWTGHAPFFTEDGTALSRQAIVWANILGLDHRTIFTNITNGNRFLTSSVVK